MYFPVAMSVRLRYYLKVLGLRREKMSFRTNTACKPCIRAARRANVQMRPCIRAARRKSSLYAAWIA